MKKRTLTFFALTLLVAFYTFGCNGKQFCSPPSSVANQLPPISKSLKVDIFLDGTTSMKGFIVPGLASRYQQTLPILESTVERGWPGGQVTFYRFGTAIQELPERKYLEAQRQSFYEEREIREKTLIQNVIDQASKDRENSSENRLTITVTDLFQTDVDVNLITSKIKEKFITKNMAVGIMGIKSEFSGNVYDVGANNYTFDYHSDNSNPATFRPFYILAFGNHADISNYFDVALKGGLESFSETQAIIFSPYVSETISSFEGSHITDTVKLQEVVDLLPPDVKADHIKQFRIPDASVPLASFTANLSYKRLRHVMPVASPELEAEVTAYTCGSLEQTNAEREPRSLVENDQAKRGFTVKSANLSDAAIDLTVEIIPAALHGAGIYCFKTTLRPKTYKMPDWVEAWNMDSSLVEAWRKTPKDFNGATTFNLKAFLTNLWENTLQVNRPKVAEFYSYVEKD